MRIYSYIFHALLALFLLAISGLSLFNGVYNLKLEMLPWTGKNLTYWLFFGALFGLLSVILALRGKVRALFFLWSLAVLVVTVRGYFFSSYYFDSPAEFKTALYLAIGALMALPGAWFQLRRRPAKR